MKKNYFILLILISFLTSAYKTLDVYEISAVNNGYFHNNIGLNYMAEKVYYAAIQEFKIAISLNPETQATSVYYNNIGNAYMEIAHPDLALDAYLNAIRLNHFNFSYYQNLAKCYKALDLVGRKIKEYEQKNSPLDQVMLGLLYIENGDVKHGIITLDNFVMSEPDLIITFSVKKYVRAKVKEMNS
ncbi:MAG: hypothetical protein R3Y28_02055 [Candidatus Gastranaerophilales bacterium]